jgi:tetratricopeptide (TPR) repeat protein
MSFLLTLALVAARGVPDTAAVDSAAFSQSYELEKTGKYAEAIDALKPVGKKSTYLLEYRLGWLYYLSGNHPVSRQHYVAASQAAQKSIEARLGFLLPTLSLVKYYEAETAARTVLSLDASHYTASVRLAYALRMQGKNRPAREVLAPMLMLYPTDVSLLIEQLYNSTVLKQNDVRELCDRILAVDPTNAEAKRIRDATP